jgi:hypothetical protein
LGLSSKCLTNQIHRNLAPAGVLGNDAEVVKCTIMPRLLGQDLPIELLGLAQSPGMVMLHGEIDACWMLTWAMADQLLEAVSHHVRHIWR